MDRTPRLTFKRLTGPALEPVTLDEAKAFARIDTIYDDALVTSLIKRAREHCEAITGRQFITATYGLLLDSFPTWCRPDVYRVTERREGTDILVPMPPLISVESITYLDASGVSQTVAASDYIVSTYDDPGRIALAYGKTWPSTLAQINAVTVAYTAGYGAAATAVPESIKQAMLMLVSAFYEQREATASSAALPKEVDFSVHALLRPYTCGELWQGSLQ
jgi:uncharacterized phiE125 gp8 family phage protein